MRYLMSVRNKDQRHQVDGQIQAAQRPLQTLAILVISSFFLSACSSSVTDPVLSFFSSFSINEAGQLSVVSNSTGAQAQCALTNRVTLQLSMSPNKKLYCREQSILMPGLKRGPVCDGGVSILEFPVSNQAVECSRLTLCGKAPSSRKIIGQRFDGGSIEEISFDNLPWGCLGILQTSGQSNAFAAEDELRVQITPPECPFCVRENKTSCLPCLALGAREVVKAGQVIGTDCQGDTCLSCEVDGKVIPHGQGTTFFSASTSSCSLRCAEMGQVRVCNNGLFEGSVKHSFSQCSDTLCGCKLPGKTTTYDSGKSLTIFKTGRPSCGSSCEGLAIRCEDGNWLDSLGQPVADQELSTRPSLTCVNPVCHCSRPGRMTIADGTQSWPAYSKGFARCTETCEQFKGNLECAGGVIKAANPSHLSFGFDSCTQEDCGCQVSTADGVRVISSPSGQLNLFSRRENSINELDACTNPANKITATCLNRSLSPNFDLNRFKYLSCTTRQFGCSFPGGSVEHNQTKTFYKEVSPACGTSCNSVALRCENTVWKKVADASPVSADFFAQYPATSCALRDCDCKLPSGDVLSHGAPPIAFYAKSEGTCDPLACETVKAMLSCQAGQILGGDASRFLYRTCQVKSCTCALPWGASIENTKKARIYALDGATCGAAGACDDPVNYVDVTCSNGTLTSYDTSKFRYQSCRPANCLCHWAGRQVPEGATSIFWKAEMAPAGSSCGSIQSEFKCVDGTFQGQEPIAHYPAGLCESLVDQGNFGGTGGGSGNDEGPGSAFRRRWGVDIGGGGGGSAPCLGVECRAHGVNAEIMQASRLPCLLPWGGGEVEMYSSVMAFRKKCVIKPAKCSSERQVRRCHFRGWTGDNDYRYPQCEEKDVCP